MTAHALHARAGRQQGFSIVELMVGLAVGLLLVAGLSLMYANASRTSGELDKSVRHIENGRYAVDLMSQDLSLAGFYGTVPLTTTTAVTSPCLGTTALKAELQAKQAASPPTLPFGVEGMTTVEAQANAATPGCMPGYKPGTPAIVVRRLDTETTQVASVAANTLYVQSSHNWADNNNSYIASTNQSDFVLKNLAGALNPVRRFVSRVYYVASCSDCSNGGDNIPTLKMTELRGTSFTESALAEGIEQIGFDYGFDTNDDGTPDKWYGLNGTAATTESTEAAALGWGNVTAVRVYLVSRTTEPTAGHTDGRTYMSGLKGETQATSFTPDSADLRFKRRAYSNTVRLNTIAGIREKP